MSRRILVISGGEFSPLESASGYDFVLACDRGCDYALRCGIKPDLVLGDFDSMSGGLPEGVTVERFVAEKDDTDTMLAVRYAVEHGYDSIDIRCALGGRLDHALANIQSAVYAASHGLEVSIADERNYLMTMLPGTLRLPRREGWSLSVFAAKDICTGVYIEGCKYPLNDATLTNHFPLGVSNAWKAPEAEIRLGEGLLLIIMSRLQA